MGTVLHKRQSRWSRPWDELSTERDWRSVNAQPATQTAFLTNQVDTNTEQVFNRAL